MKLGDSLSFVTLQFSEDLNNRGYKMVDLIKIKDRVIEGEVDEVRDMVKRVKELV